MPTRWYKRQRPLFPIARAGSRQLANNPVLILADEPTANLDAKNGHEITCLLREIAKEQQRSVIILSHDQRVKDVADRVLWLEDGKYKEIAQMLTAGRGIGNKKTRWRQV